MRGICLVIGVAMATHVSGETCDFGSRSDDAPPETRQFEFLLGDHDVALHAWTGEGWTPPRPVNARWRGWYGLSGHAIYDEWEDPQPNTGGAGINVRLYDPAQQVWKMMWVSTTGKQVQDLRAEERNGVLTMWQVYPERPGWKAEFEMLDDTRWARVEYQQDASGVWQPRFRLVATREDCQ